MFDKSTVQDNRNQLDSDLSTYLVLYRLGIVGFGIKLISCCCAGCSMFNMGHGGDYNGEEMS